VFGVLVSILQMTRGRDFGDRLRQCMAMKLERERERERASEKVSL
jgi:hypothetical protein